MDTQLTVRLPADLRKALERASATFGVKNSEIVRRALRSFLEQPARNGARPADRVRDLLGSLETGIDDLAEKHRDYILDSLQRER